MEVLKNILVVSRMVSYDAKAIRTGASLARAFGAKLTVIHVIHDPFRIEGWNLPLPNLEKDYRKLLQKTREDLDRLVERERAEGLPVEVMLQEGDPMEEILRTVREKKIDLMILLAHEEGHLEHFLFGRSNHDLVRRMPCSVLLVKKEPEAVPGD